MEMMVFIVRRGMRVDDVRGLGAGFRKSGSWQLFSRNR